MQLRFHGVRGSIPTPGAATSAYGGNTCCVEISTRAGQRLILDCGTGLRGVSASASPYRILLTHYHADHIQGLPFFLPLYDKRSEIVFHGPAWNGQGVRDLLEQAIRPPWLPVALSETPSLKRFEDLPRGALDVDGWSIRHVSLVHPQGVVAYRVEREGASIVFATDCEPPDGETDTRLREFAAGADLLIHDAQYTQEEYESQHRGWGHSSWRHAVATATAAQVGQLVLFHHDPDRSDDELDRIVARARGGFPGVIAAREGLTVEV